MAVRKDNALQFDGVKGVGINDSTGALEPVVDVSTSLGTAGVPAAAKRFLEVLAETLTAQSDAGVRFRVVPMEETITLATDGLTTDSTANLLMANAIIAPVFCEVMTTITTATGWSVGISGTAARFLANTTDLTAGTTKVGMAHLTGTVAFIQAAAAKVRITAAANNPGAGAVRVTVFNLVVDKAS